MKESIQKPVPPPYPPSPRRTHMDPTPYLILKPPSNNSKQDKPSQAKTASSFHSSNSSPKPHSKQKLLRD